MLIAADTSLYVVYVLTRHITPGTGSSGYSGDGSAATSASLYYPNGVAVGSTGNLYIGDQFNHRIRKVSTTGVITTIAGTKHAVAVYLVQHKAWLLVSVFYRLRVVLLIYFFLGTVASC